MKNLKQQIENINKQISVLEEDQKSFEKNDMRSIRIVSEIIILKMKIKEIQEEIENQTEDQLLGFDEDYYQEIDEYDREYRKVNFDEVCNQEQNDNDSIENEDKE
jgi:hypothetical protein